MALVLVLGLSMSFAQTYFDFETRSKEVDKTIQSIIESSKASASSAVFLMDPALAEQIIKGLKNFEFAEYVALIDDRGNVMFASNDEPTNYVNPVLRFITPNYTSYEVAVGESNFTGKLILNVNNHIALRDVYQRAVRTFGISLLGFIVMSAALILLNHNSLAVPLIKLSDRFQRVNTADIVNKSIQHLKDHEKNEFGRIVDSANDLLTRIANDQTLLSQRNQRFRLILDTAPLLIFAVDNDGKIAFANKSTAVFFGYSIFELKGKHALSVIEEFDLPLSRAIKEFADSEHDKLNHIFDIKNAEREQIICEISMVKFDSHDGENLLIVCNDVTKRVKAEKQAAKLAYSDSLTDLPNRNSIYQTLEELIRQRADDFHVVIFADLDQFKRINDTLSHSVGDKLIKALSERLVRDFAGNSRIARLGADEFLLVQDSVSKEHQTAKVIAIDVAERLRESINQDIELAVHSYSLTASIGAVVFRGRDETADLIFQYADTAMYESKKKGRNCVTFFEHHMAAKAAERLQLERDISNAMANEEFYFVLQPILDSDDHSLVSAEALIRWKKNAKVIPPNEFIPFLEESALIIEVGDIMLNNVCKYLASLMKEKRLRESFKVAVNISGRQFSEDAFVSRITNILRKYQISGRHLEFEITESVALENLSSTVNKILELKKFGISFSLDDFGTGYSSLSHLKDLPVDKLKIDQAFINDVTIDSQDANLVRSIIQLSSNLGLVTVAEGVETLQQAEWLSENGHMLLQGYYFSRPIQPSEFNNLYLQ